MQKSEKTSQYTFGEKEQQILEILASLKMNYKKNYKKQNQKLKE